MIESNNAMPILAAAKMGATLMKRYTRNGKEVRGKPPLFMGASGAGKSAIAATVVRGILAEHEGLEVGDDEGEFKFWDLRLQTVDAPDVRGLPKVEDDLSVWCPPDWLPKAGESGLFLIDEINAVTDKSIMFALYQLIQDRAIGNYKLPAGVYVMACANRDIDSEGLEDLPAPLRQKFWVKEVVPTLVDWRDHAIEVGLDIRIIASAVAYPELVTDWDGQVEEQQSTGRELSACSDALFNWEREGHTKSGLRELFAGFVGYVAATKIATMVTQFSDLIPVSKIVESPKSAPLPESFDMECALAVSLANCADRNNLEAMITYLGRIQRQEVTALFRCVLLKSKGNAHHSNAYDEFVAV